MATLTRWQKSSYSEAASSCIYLAEAPAGAVQLRESETPESILAVSPTRLRALISRIKANKLDRHALMSF
ncbi:DUF397 domain-containing protein [Streptomyces sp. NPDC002537]